MPGEDVENAKTMKINSNDYRVKPEKKLKLAEWPTIGKPVCDSKKKYHSLLADHVERLSELQRLHYASNRYALLIIFQGMDAGGKDGAVVSAGSPARIAARYLSVFALVSASPSPAP